MKIGSPTEPLPDRLWDARDLAKFLGYAERTVMKLASEAPERLPPRIGALGRQRWLPEVVHAWVREQSAIAAHRPKLGRPRRRVIGYF